MEALLPHYVAKEEGGGKIIFPICFYNLYHVLALNVLGSIFAI